MRIIDNEFTDVETSTGAMRTYLFRPRDEGRFPGIVLFTEIFQVTHQMRRAAAVIAGHGFLVAVPEIFHEDLPSGRALPYSDEGRTQGRRLMSAKEWGAYDADAAAALNMLTAHGRCTGRLGVMGFCFGGHLAVRAALRSEVGACACFYPTALHGGRSDREEETETLGRLKEARGEFGFFVGTQDELLPGEGRRRILEGLETAGANYRWHEYRAGHAFMRDGGPDHDPEVAHQAQGETVGLFRRALCG